MKIISIALLSIFSLSLAGCGEHPETDADLAGKYNMSMEEFQEQKEAAARMNMSIEDHLGAGDMGDMKDKGHNDDH